jgi:GntR family histidine utilization transcriptional repressor
VSLHERIVRELGARIISGELAPGQPVPSEAELMAAYKCSRMTVYKAMSELSSRGLIARKRGSGSVVSKPQFEQAVLEIQDFAKAADKNGHSYEYELLSREETKVTTSEAARLSVPAGNPILRLKCLHRINNLPIAIENRVIHLAAVPQARRESFESVPPGTWLLQKVPWTEAEHAIRAVSADKSTAQLLEIARSAACLVLHRVTWRLGSPITDVRLVYAGERYQFVGHLQPANGAASANGNASPRLQTVAI